MTDSTLTSQPRRIHPVLRQPRSRGRDPILRDRGPLALRSMHGQVARFSGVVDRFGGKVKLGTIVPTLCIRSLRHTASGRVVEPEHAWFRLSQEWSDQALQTGDAVQFTAKVHRVTKGWQDGASSGNGGGRVREQVIGFAGQVRDVVVTRRAPRSLDPALELRRQLQEREASLTAADRQKHGLALQLAHGLRALRLQRRRTRLALAWALGLGLTAGALLGWTVASLGEGPVMESATAPPERRSR